MIKLAAVDALKQLSRRGRLFSGNGIWPDRHFFLRRNFVFRFGHAHQPMIEPADNIFQSLDAMPRLAGTRKLMRFVRETHHYRRDLAKLERAKHFFTAGAWRRAEIGLA